MTTRWIHTAALVPAILAVAMSTGCASDSRSAVGSNATTSAAPATSSAAAQPEAKVETKAEAEAEVWGSAYDKPGFVTRVEDGRLWVLRPGQKAAEKHITLIAAGPANMSIRALDKETALAYITFRSGFITKVEDGNRLWVLKPGEKATDKHITLVGAGPRNMTIKALSKETALSYLLARDGFDVTVDAEENRIWVLRPGQKISDKHITLVAAGPRNMTVKAADKVTALEYIAARDGFNVKVDDDGYLWVLKPGQKASEKHITRVAAGPRRMTIKGVDRETLDAYLSMM